MADSPDEQEALQSRLHHLEAEIVKIRRQLDQPKSPPALPGSTPPPLPPVNEGGSASISPAETPDSLPVRPSQPLEWKPELWIGRLGVGLLILGVIFLFQFAAEQGWFGPWFRVGLGAVLGGVLFTAGLRMESAQRWYRQLLFGASIAIWYLSVFAAGGMYQLVPAGLALLLILIVAVVAFLLAVREQSGTIGCLATVGGLISPLVLLDGTSITAMELLYMLIIADMAMLVYCRRGGSLQVLLVFLLGGLILVEAGEGNGTTGARIFIQVSWLLWGLSILLSAWWRSQFLRTGKFPVGLPWLCPESPQTSDRSALVTSLTLILLPLIWFIATSGLWNLPKPQAGWLALVVALAAFTGRRHLLTGSSRSGYRGTLSDIFLFHSLLFGLGAVVMILDGSPQLLCVALIGCGMIQWGIVNRSGWFRALGNFLFSSSLVWALIRVAEASGGFDYKLGGSVQCWVDFLVILMAIGQSALPTRRTEGIVYWMFGMPLLLLWIMGLVSEYEYSSPVVTLLWAGVMVACLLGGLVFRRRLWSGTSVLLLFVVLFKLFFIDLANVEAAWRVALFLFLGLVFMGVSYLISRLRQQREGDDENDSSKRPPALPVDTSDSSALDKSQIDEKIDTPS